MKKGRIDLCRNIRVIYPEIKITYHPSSRTEIATLVQKSHNGIPYLIPVTNKYECTIHSITGAIRNFYALANDVNRAYIIDPENEITNI